jgi:HEAT repeat protein
MQTRFLVGLRIWSLAPALQLTFARGCLLALVCGLGASVPAFAQDSGNAEEASPAATTEPPTANPTTGESTTAVPPATTGDADELRGYAQKLPRVERELLELRAKTGRIPEDRLSQKLIVLVESPGVGTYYAGDAGNERFFAGRLVLVNLTAAPISIPRDEITLVVDGQRFPLQPLSDDLRGHAIQNGEESVSLEEIKLPTKIQVTSGGVQGNWLAFDELPPGNHTPELVLELGPAGSLAKYDITAAQRDALALKTDRLGPRKSLGLVTISGQLNTISVGGLIAAFDALAAGRVTRVLLCFDDTATIPDQQLVHWLASQASTIRNSDGDGVFPPIAATVRDLYLASVPGDSSSSRLENAYPGLIGRLFTSQEDGVLAALSEAYRTVPRDELESTILSGSRLERASALRGGGGRVSPELVPRLLALSDDADPLVQSAAIDAIRHFGEPDCIAQLLKFVRAGQEPSASAAVASLAASRFPAAHEALLKLLANEPPESKKQIVQVLARHPRPIWSETLFEYVSDTRGNLRSAALTALVQVGHPKLMDALQTGLSDSSEEYSQLAFTLLVSRGDAASEALALAHTLKVIQTEEPSVQMLALLGRMKDPRCLPSLVARLEKSSNRVAIIQTLGQIGADETAKALDERYAALPPHEQAECLRALHRLDPALFRRRAAEALLSTDSNLISVAVQGLQEDSGPEAIGLMVEMWAKSTNAYAWSYLANALATVATVEAKAALIEARDSGPGEKHDHAQNALEALKQRSPGYQSLYQGQSFARDKKWKEALEQFEQAIQLDPFLADAYAGRADVYLQTQKFAESGRDFAKAYELDPYNSVALTGVCIVLAITDPNCEEAVKKAEAGRAKFARQPLYLYNLACVYGRSVEQVSKRPESPERNQLLDTYRQAGIESLSKSIVLGFRDLKWMQEDPDLKAFSDLPEFRKLVTNPPKPGEAAAARPDAED